MAISYVLVTAAAVAVVEIIGLALVMPGLLADRSGDPELIVQLTASDLASEVMKRSLEYGRLPHADEMKLGDVALGPGDDARVRIPYLTTLQNETAPVTLAFLLDMNGTILLSSYPGRHPVGGQAAGDGVVELSPGVLAKFQANGKAGSSGDSKTSTGSVYWAIAPVFALATAADRKVTAKPKALGFVYVQVPTGTPVPRLSDKPAKTSWWKQVLPQLGFGLLVLLVALPVGVVFGLLSTRSLIGRLRRLAASTVALADGKLEQRVPVSGADEVAQLETNFNRMAERLTDAMAAERQLAGASERARIARELHDSISQDLFSLRLLAGGLRRALPADSRLHHQIEAMETTATGTMHEMQALLLELRPIALNDTGLIPALEQLCQAYRDRLGVAVDAELEPVEMAPPVEHAALRIVQEALTNAIKHARPRRLALRVHPEGEQVSVSISDDGAGFDPARAAERHGMGLDLMRERVTELGGDVKIDSVIGEGTTLRIRLPRSRP